jgi:hypothetical protein
LSTAAPSGTRRHQNLYAHHMWRQQRFYAGALVAVGLVATSLLLYQGQLLVPSGLFLGGAFLLYRRRSHVQVTDSGIKVSTMFNTVLLDYDSIRSVKAMPLRTHFLEGRTKMVAPIMKQQIDKPALFIKVRGDDSELAQIKKKLGSRLVNDDTIAIPIPDPDAAVWEITEHLPERIGHNQGGAKRRKRRR